MRALLYVVLAASLIACTPYAHAQQSISVPRADGAVTPLMVYDTHNATCPPLALVSPGAGGTEKGMVYLGDALSKDGWRTIVLGHQESGPEALRGDMRRAGLRRGLQDLVADPNAYRGRFMDIDAALKWSEQRCHTPFKALVGHSMGARTVMLEAGAQSRIGVQGKNIFDAYVALSPPGTDEVFPPGAERTVTSPILLITGTQDDTIDKQGYQSRVDAFEALRSTCAWLAVIDGSSHLNFAGVGFSGKTETATVALTTDFLDSLRNGRCARPPSLAGVSVTSK
ncbi:MAG TPA: alpha/beta hydrolase [Xanthomonadaceae bacterium]|jgi:dienelactone hydrolase|nr:alpha/beta hydrolase [Xanthomonadaceae bacterium]